MKSLDGETRVVMEQTGRYYEQIAQYLHDKGIYISAVKPKLIKDYGTGNTLRHVKTDKADAKKIAKFGLDRWTELREHAPMDTVRYQLKMLNQQCGLYTKTKTMMKNCQGYFKMSIFAEMECRYLQGRIQALYSLMHHITRQFEARQVLIYWPVSGLTGKNGKYNYSKAVHLYPLFFDIFCSTENCKTASALTQQSPPHSASSRSMWMVSTYL